MEQLTFDFNFGELKIGDKVKIIDKSVGDPLPCYGWNLGDVAFVREFYESDMFYYLRRVNEGIGENGVFLAKDLRRIL